MSIALLKMLNTQPRNVIDYERTLASKVQGSQARVAEVVEYWFSASC